MALLFTLAEDTTVMESTVEPSVREKVFRWRDSDRISSETAGHHSRSGEAPACESF